VDDGLFWTLLDFSRCAPCVKGVFDIRGGISFFRVGIKNRIVV